MITFGIVDNKSDMMVPEEAKNSDPLTSSVADIVGFINKSSLYSMLNFFW